MLSSPFDALKLSMELKSRGELEAAITILKERMDSFGSSEDSQALAILTNHFAILCDSARRPALAIEYLRRCLARSPRDLELLYNLARNLIVTRQIDEARAVVEHFRAACETSTDELRDHWAQLYPSLERDLRILSEGDNS